MGAASSKQPLLSNMIAGDAGSVDPVGLADAIGAATELGMGNPVNPPKYPPHVVVAGSMSFENDDTPERHFYESARIEKHFGPILRDLKMAGADCAATSPIIPNQLYFLRSTHKTATVEEIWGATGFDFNQKYFRRTNEDPGTGWIVESQANDFFDIPAGHKFAMSTLHLTLHTPNAHYVDALPQDYKRALLDNGFPSFEKKVDTRMKYVMGIPFVEAVALLYASEIATVSWL